MIVGAAIVSLSRAWVVVARRAWNYSPIFVGVGTFPIIVIISIHHIPHHTRHLCWMIVPIFNHSHLGPRLRLVGREQLVERRNYILLFDVSMKGTDFSVGEPVNAHRRSPWQSINSSEV